MADQPHRISIEPAVETDTAMPLRASKTMRIEPAIEHDVALPLTVQRVVPATAGGGTVDLQISSTSPLSPRVLTSEEQTIIGLIAQLGATFAAMSGASAGQMLFVGLVLYLLLREFTRRCLPPSD